MIFRARSGGPEAEPTLLSVTAAPADRTRLCPIRGRRGHRRARFQLILAESERSRANPQPRLVAALLRPADDILSPGSVHPESASPSSEVAPPTSVHAARPVTCGDLARVRSMRAHLKAIDNAHGGGTVLPMATAYQRSEILPLLDGCDRSTVSQSLMEAVAEYEHDVGWMAYDAGQQDVAERYLASALRRARRGYLPVMRVLGRAMTLGIGRPLCPAGTPSSRACWR
jgi:hypothetical protein